MFVIILVAWVIVAFIAAKIAGDKGRSYGKTLALGLIFSPLISLLVAFALSPNSKKQETNALREGTSRKCPSCAELVKVEANVCRFCGVHLPRELLDKGSPESTEQQYNYLPETMSLDEFVAKAISDDESKGFLGKQGLKNFKNPEWWSGEYRKYLKPRIVSVRQPSIVHEVPPPPPRRSERILRIAKDGEDLGEVIESQVMAMLKNNTLSLKDYYLDTTKNEWIELSALFGNIS
jgi:hypothetical protein